MRTIKLNLSKSLIAVLLAGASVLMVAPSAQAEEMDEALRFYKAKNYTDAAFAFYDVLQSGTDPDIRDKAEIYLAETLFKRELYVPALFYYTDIFRVGRTNRYYLNAVEGLLKVQEKLRDWVLVPSLISENFDPEGLSNLGPDEVARVNYMIGQLSFTQGKNEDAQEFLSFVQPESRFYAKARYLLGVIKIRLGKPEEALPHFRAVVDIVPEDSPSKDLLEVRGLAQVAAGRAAYGIGRYAESADHYAAVPRFSRHWFTAMYESAWTYYKQAEYGKALGELHTVTSPYFAKRHVPEAYVIQGTTYFLNCQWDRVRRAVKTYKRTYEPMLGALKGYLEQAQDPAAVYRDVAEGGNGKFALEVARETRRSKRFRDYHFLLEHLKWEGKEVAENPKWRGTKLAGDLSAIIGQQLEGLEPVVGAWVKRQLMNRMAMLQNFQSQVELLDFEVTDAEAEWLAQGREILKGRRRRLPRPDIPNDQWQHWNFDGEYWKGELGYFHHSIRSECE